MHASGTEILMSKTKVKKIHQPVLQYNKRPYSHQELMTSSSHSTSPSQMVAELYRSHACMLEWQGQVSMLLGKLSTMVDHKTFLTIAYTMVKLLHQILLLLTVTMKLSPLTPPRHVPHNEWIFQRILPDPAKLKDWAEDLATLYLMATLSYTVREALLGSGNMKDMAKTFCVKLTTLQHCINSHKYTGSSKKKPAQQ